MEVAGNARPVRQGPARCPRGRREAPLRRIGRSHHDQALVHRERVTVSAGVGDGDGSWRLELDMDLDIEARAYAYTPEDVGRIDQTVAEIGGTAMRYDVPFFNPASNVAKRSTHFDWSTSAIPWPRWRYARSMTTAMRRPRVWCSSPSRAVRRAS